MSMTHETQTKRLAPELLFAAVEEQLALGRKASFTVTGISMWPFIASRRDQVVVAACNPEKLHVGDIILFQTPLGNYMLHRITALKSGSFETTGDGNCFRDGWFPRSCVRAKVETITRNGRTIDCSRFGWRHIFTVWRILFPLRKPLLRLMKRLGAIKARLRKWIH